MVVLPSATVWPGDNVVVGTAAVEAVGWPPFDVLVPFVPPLVPPVVVVAVGLLPFDVVALVPALLSPGVVVEAEESLFDVVVDSAPPLVSPRVVVAAFVERVEKEVEVVAVVVGIIGVPFVVVVVPPSLDSAGQAIPGASHLQMCCECSLSFTDKLTPRTQSGLFGTSVSCHASTAESPS